MTSTICVAESSRPKALAVVQGSNVIKDVLTDKIVNEVDLPFALSY